jgi:hypothetical protein
MKKNICNCETCSDKGWIETSVYNSMRIADGTLVVEKCDECNIFISDNSAAKFAFDKENIFTFETESGFNVIMEVCLN